MAPSVRVQGSKPPRATSWPRETLSPAPRHEPSGDRMWPREQAPVLPCEVSRLSPPGLELSPYLSARDARCDLEI